MTTGTMMMMIISFEYLNEPSGSLKKFTALFVQPGLVGRCIYLSSEHRRRQKRGEKAGKQSILNPFERSDVFNVVAFVSRGMTINSDVTAIMRHF